MGYKLGKRSQRELEGVRADLGDVVRRAIEITEQDFTVYEGLRTDAEQEKLLASGASHVKKSKHQEQDDGYGHAVDLGAYINRKIRWELELYYPIAEAMRQAAKELGVKLRWGACWRRIDNTKLDLRVLVEEYVSKRRAAGRKPFIDAVHFEVMD